MRNWSSLLGRTFPLSVMPKAFTDSARRGVVAAETAVICMSSTSCASLDRLRLAAPVDACAFLFGPPAIATSVRSSRASGISADRPGLPAVPGRGSGWAANCLCERRVFLQPESSLSLHVIATLQRDEGSVARAGALFGLIQAVRGGGCSCPCAVPDCTASCRRSPYTAPRRCATASYPSERNSHQTTMDDSASIVKPWVTFAGCVLVVVVLYWAQAVFVPFALALLLTFVLTPPVTSARALDRPRTGRARRRHTGIQRARPRRLGRGAADDASGRRPADVSRQHPHEDRGRAHGRQGRRGREAAGNHRRHQDGPGNTGGTQARPRRDPWSSRRKRMPGYPGFEWLASDRRTAGNGRSGAGDASSSCCSSAATCATG